MILLYEETAFFIKHAICTSKSLTVSEVKK